MLKLALTAVKDCLYCCLQDRAPGSLNADYVSREGGTMRATKTSSASLVKASGKEGEGVHKFSSTG